MGNGVCLTVCMLFVFCSSLQGLLVECNGLRLAFSGFLFTCAFYCFLFHGVAALTWLAWLFGFMMIMMTGVDTAFCLLCGGNLLSRIMSMHCIQGIEKRRRIEHFQKIQISNKTT